RGALAAGALFGAAATMRTEALVYLVVATGCAGLVILVRDRRPVRTLVTGCAALVGAVVPLVGERLLEQWTIGSDLRGSRVAGTASGAGASLVDRLREAVTTTVGLNLRGLGTASEAMIGVLVVALLTVAAWGITRWVERREIRNAIGSVAGLVVLFVYL